MGAGGGGSLGSFMEWNWSVYVRRVRKSLCTTTLSPLIQILRACVLTIRFLNALPFYPRLLLASAFRTIGKCFNRIGSN